jgi:uncharacterized membrane protein
VQTRTDVVEGVDVSYEEVVSDVVNVVEGVGGAIMVIGAAIAFVAYGKNVAERGADAYRQLRQDLGRVILLGLEVLIIADIIRTIVVDQSVESVAVLGLIVLIRIVLSFSLEVEIDGAWPWNQWKVTSLERAAASLPSADDGRARDTARR